MKTALLQHVERCLDQWAAWVIKGEDWGLGYPRQSLEARLKAGGGKLIRTGRQHYLSDPPAVLEIDRHIVALKQFEPLLASALYCEYLIVGTQVQRARRAGMPTTQFRLRVDRAKHWLAGRLQD